MNACVPHFIQGYRKQSLVVAVVPAHRAVQTGDGGCRVKTHPDLDEEDFNQKERLLQQGELSGLRKLQGSQNQKKKTVCFLIG